MKAIITVGCSASGKSTWAKKFIDDSDDVYVEINRDDLREIVLTSFDPSWTGAENLWSKWKFNSKNENIVTSLVNDRIEFAKKSSYNLIISDTNLDFSKREHLTDKLEQLGYEVETKVFGLDLSIDDLWERDKKRRNSVGRDVIAKQYYRFRKEFPRYAKSDAMYLPKAVIYDIDGTLAHMKGRSAYDWDHVDQDEPDELVTQILIGHYYQGYKIIIMSGRNEVCRPATEEWIKKYIPAVEYELYMRLEDDLRKDTLVKHDMYFQHVDGVYNVVAVFDDRPSVTRLWYDLDFKVFHCANPWVEF